MLQQPFVSRARQPRVELVEVVIEQLRRWRNDVCCGQSVLQAGDLDVVRRGAALGLLYEPSFFGLLEERNAPRRLLKNVF